MSGARPAASGLVWRPRAYLLVGAGVVLLLLAVAFRDPVAVFVALPLLVAPVAAALGAPSGPLAAALDWGDRGTGTEVTISGRMRGSRALRVRDWDVEFDRPPPLPLVSPVSVQRTPEELRFEVRWRAPEPTVVLVAPPRVVWRDPIGLVERPVGGSRPELVVERYPPELLRLGAIRLDRTLVLPGEIRSRRIGSSGDFFGIRDAAPNDPPRRINWPASARAGRLLANEYLLDRAADVLLLVDARPTPLGAELDTRLLGVARAAAQGIADSLLREKLRVGYATFGEFVDAVPLSSGRVHRTRIHRAILATRRSAVGGPSERCPVSLRRFFPAGLTVLVLSSLASPEALELVPHLRRRGYPVAVLSPSPLPVSGRDPPLPTADEPLAARLAALDRRDRLASTWVHAPVVDWSDFWSLGGFARLLRQQGRRRGA